MEETSKKVRQTREIKDYLHLYLGCECQTDEGKIGWFSGFDVCERDYSITMITVRFSDKSDDWTVLNDNEECDRIKLILRPLSDMTEEEDQIELPKHNRGEFIDMHWYPEGYVWLLSKGFDLFGLIDEGLAINKTTLSQGEIKTELI